MLCVYIITQAVFWTPCLITYYILFQPNLGDFYISSTPCNLADFKQDWKKANLLLNSVLKLVDTTTSPLLFHIHLQMWEHPWADKNRGQ